MSRKQSASSALVVCDDAVSGSESDKDTADELRVSMEGLLTETSHFMNLPFSQRSHVSAAFDKRITEVESEHDPELSAEFQRIEDCRKKNLEVAKTHFQCRLKSIQACFPCAKTKLTQSYCVHFHMQSEYEFDVRASNNEADASRIAAKESLVKTLKDCKNRLHFEYLGATDHLPARFTTKVCSGTWLYEDESSRVTRASRTKKDGSDPSAIVSLSRNDDNPVSRVNSLQVLLSSFSFSKSFQRLIFSVAALYFSSSVCHRLRCHRAST
jgi:hypothetical protein